MNNEINKFKKMLNKYSTKTKKTEKQVQGLHELYFNLNKGDITKL